MAAYQAAITVGIALGSWMWGSIANGIGVEGAAHFWRRLGCFAIARLVDADADGQRP